MTAVLALLAPKMYKTFADKLHRLFEHMPGLNRYAPMSVFTTASFDFNDGRPCRIHDHHPNGSLGWCSLYAGGDYDPTTGGHLYLPQVQLLIEFPPGATVLLPSNLVYGIVPVAPGQTRYTFSQYIPADLIRYVDNGFCTRRSETGECTLPLHLNLDLLSHVEGLDDDRRSTGLLSGPARDKPSCQ